MGTENFKTLYKANFSSGGAIQNEIVPSHVDAIISLIDAMSNDSNAIVPLRNKIRTLFILYKKGLEKPERIKERFVKINKMISEWQKTYRNQNPLALVNEMLELSEDFFEQWNSSGAGIIFSVHDANRERKLYDQIVGNV